MWTLLIGIALAASPWDGLQSDVVVSRTVPAPATEVYARLTDLRQLEAMFPDDCAQDWTYGEVTSGVGAQVTMTYKWSLARRRLAATITNGEEGRWFDLDHHGDKGFVTRFRLEPLTGGTRVEATTYVDAPPWPVRGRYFMRVRPMWAFCYSRLLGNLERVVSGSEPR